MSIYDKAVSLYQRATQAYKEGDLVDASNGFRVAASLHESCAEEVDAAKSYHMLGRTRHRLQDYEGSRDAFLASLAIDKKREDKPNCASTLHNLGSVTAELGEYEAAAAFLKESISIKSELGDQAGLATSYGQLGVVRELQGDLASAEKLYRQSLQDKEACGNYTSAAITYANLLNIAIDEKRDEDAAEFRTCLFDSLEKSIDRSSALTAISLGQTADENLDIELAAKLFHRGRKIASDCDDGYALSRACHFAAAIECKRGNYDAAVKLFKEASGYYRDLNDAKRLAAVYVSVGNIYHAVKPRDEEGRHESIGVAKLWYQAALKHGKHLDWRTRLGVRKRLWLIILRSLFLRRRRVDSTDS